jgi:hypothetical protein
MAEGCDGYSSYTKHQTPLTAPFIDVVNGGSEQEFELTTEHPDFPSHMPDLVMTDFPFETSLLDSTQLQFPLSGNCEGYLEGLLDFDRLSQSLQY